MGEMGNPRKDKPANSVIEAMKRIGNQYTILECNTKYRKAIKSIWKQ